MPLPTPRQCGGITPICCVLSLRREGAECRHAYTLECVQEAESHFPLHISKQTTQIVVCRTVESCCKGGAVHGFEAPDHDHPCGFYALEPLVIHCVQKTKCINAHTMTNKTKLCQQPNMLCVPGFCFCVILSLAPELGASHYHKVQLISCQSMTLITEAPVH